MCDTLCLRRRGRMLFAKSSDRPPSEVQLIEAHPAREPGGSLRTQYLTVPDTGAVACVLARPAWLWGAEHGVNERRVAIGNERVYTVDDAATAPPALIGMDLVRLGLERGTSADGALEAMVELLETHGQGGVADDVHGEAYYSSFLVADPTGAWVLETSGRTWAARRVQEAVAISNRLSIRTDWTRASADVAPGSDFDTWRDPEAWTGHADRRLEATGAVATAGDEVGPRELVAALRHHGSGPWGAPGDPPSEVRALPPREVAPDGTGVTVCMHVRGYQATTSSMVAELPDDPSEPLRAWTAPGSPCVSVFVPTFPPDVVPPELSHVSTWERFARLRDQVEVDDADAAEDHLRTVREVLGPLETDLWEEADAAAADPTARVRFARGIWARLEAALRSLGV